MLAITTNNKHLIIRPKRFSHSILINARIRHKLVLQIEDCNLGRVV